MSEKNDCSDEAQYREAVRSMNNGDDSAKTTVAYYLLTGKGGAEYNPEKAVALLQERALIDAKALWMLGLCHEYGFGIEKDAILAGQLYGRSASAGNTVGHLLGIRISSHECFNGEGRCLFRIFSTVNDDCREECLSDINRFQR